MSLGEIVVILCVSVFCLKPGDLTIILRKIREMKSYFSEINKQLFNAIEDTKQTNITTDILPENHNRINFYLTKIINLGEIYDGEYDLEKIKSKYHEIIQNKLMQKQHSYQLEMTSKLDAKK